MYKHSTTHRTLSRRLAALLAALALLAAMALPVYAEALEDATQMQETVEMDNNGETDNNVETGSDDETDDKSETNEDTGAGADTDSNDTNDNASPNPGANSTTQADNAAADKTAPCEEKTDLTEEDTADGGEGPADEAGAKETFFEADTCSEDETESDDRSAPMTASNEGGTASFIPTTATIYFEDNGRYDELSESGQNCTMRFLGFTRNGKDVFINKVMEDTKTTVTVTGQNGTTTIHKIFKITLNSADYPAGGFYRIAFQYYINNNKDWKEEINAFGRDDGVNENYLTAIDRLAGKKFVRKGDEASDKDRNHFNQNQPYNPSQWKRVDYYYKDTPLYFKNESSTALTNVTATFYKLKDGTTTTEETGSQPIGTVDAGKFAAQQIRIPNNESRFVKFTWGENGQSDLYDFTTDYTENHYEGAQQLDLTTQNCYVCDGTGGTWASTASDLLTKDKTIYFDATLSEYSYKGEGESIEKAAMPGADKTLYCLLTGPDGAVKSLMMTPTPETAPDTSAKRKLWSCKIPDGTYTAVQFCTTKEPNAPAYNKTKQYSTAQIPPTLKEPCFFADDGDPTAYNPNDSRDGYWGEKDSVRDAESGKNNPVVDIKDGTFTQEPGTKYITSTLYDYYTDYELNGLNRDTYPYSDLYSQRGFVTFEQFNRALSRAYKNNANVKYPLYTGHFQPSINDWGNRFETVAPGMGLYGWDKVGSPAYNTFMAVNNSALDTNGTQSGDYNRTFQGLVENKTSDGTADGLPLLKRSDEKVKALADPHFDKDFLQGKNAFNTVLGKVYENVSFPLKQKAVFADNPDNPTDADAQYWYFDSNETSLYLQHDSARQSYYLAGQGTNDASLNRDSGNGTDGEHGFFPFNQTVGNGNASRYNYGFGAKLQFDFTLTEDGQVTVGQSKVPIQFFFSGDDDVWVYIDGELVLDVGGAHDRASGLLEFGKGEDGKNTVTSWVSDAKAGGQVYKGQTQGNQKNVRFNKKDYTFWFKNETPNETPKTLKKQPIHTLTMFYMERGMWESNMAVAFNFPDHNELQVEKRVDVSDVNPLFRSSFLNQKIFTFNIQNLATHYAAKDTSYKEGETKALPAAAYTGALNPSDASAKLEYAAEPPNSQDGDLAVLWSATMDDPTSEYREKRRGTLPLSEKIDIRQYRYLTFDVYVKGDKNDTCALGNLYVELRDTENNQKGCINGKGLQSSDVYGAATALHPGQWYTIRLLLNSLETNGSFNNILERITVGDNFAREIYLRNFTFRSAPEEQTTTGFTTEQYNIPDYGSAATGTLQNAAYAVFSSDRGNGDVVDEDGQLLLQAGETVTFKDQFRRGSYIALKELTDDKLYDTSWTVYENGEPVTSVNGKEGVVKTGSVTTLKNVPGTAPNDDRTEQVINGDLDGHLIQNAYTEAKKPEETDTLVFRSYSGTADKDELTKLKVVFTNKVKTGKLIIRKEPAPDETLDGQTFTFTVKFSDVGGQGLGGDIAEQKCYCTVTRQADGKEYGEAVIDRIPVGTRFVVSEDETTDTSLQWVSFTGGEDCAVTEDGKRVRGAIAEGDDKAVTATFVNTRRQLIDIEVTKQWKKQNGTTDIPSNELPEAIYLQLQRTETPDDANSWKPVPEYKRVELKPVGYEGWTHLFTGLDKYDANKAENDRILYTYRVLEGTLERQKDGSTIFKPVGNDGILIINGNAYKAESTTYKAESTTADKSNATITLTNTLQDPKFTLDVTKKSAENDGEKGQQKLLAGVEFTLEKLTKDNNENTVVDKDFGTLTGVTDGKGELYLKKADGTTEAVKGFKNLEAGTYRLTETKAAKDYNLLSEPIIITFSKDGQCQVGNETPRHAEAGTIFTGNAADGYTLSLTVLNRKTPALPHTGADAPSLWLLIGLPLAVAGLLILVFRYNKKGGRTR